MGSLKQKSGMNVYLRELAQLFPFGNYSLSLLAPSIAKESELLEITLSENISDVCKLEISMANRLL